MSEDENLAVVRKTIESFSNDVETWLGKLRSRGHVVIPQEEHQTLLLGRDAALKRRERWRETFQEGTYGARDPGTGGGTGKDVFSVLREWGRGRGSGIEVEDHDYAHWKSAQRKDRAWPEYPTRNRPSKPPGCGSNTEVARWTRRGRIATASPFAGYSTSMISIVAVGTDGSETADEAVREAAEIARRFGAKLVLLSAFERSKGSSAARSQNVELQWTSNSSARVRSILERIEEDLGKDGIDCETRADEGDAGEVLVRLAEECGADLLVIGNKGMKRRVLGSVPNTVTHNAGCSVLVVKTT